MSISAALGYRWDGTELDFLSNCPDNYNTPA